jgi:hypothetical protein
MSTGKKGEGKRRAGRSVARGPGAFSQDRPIFSIMAGLLGAIAFIFLFPGASITTAMHEVMRLPGPGAGIGMLYGPFIVLVALMAYFHIRRTGAILLTSISFGVFHAALAPAVYGDVKTAGTIGPPHLRIVAVVVLGVVLWWAVRFLDQQKDHVRYPAASVLASFAVMCFYWAAIFPNSPKGPVAAADVPVLLGVTALGAVVIGGLLPLVLRDVLPGFAARGRK